MSTDSEWIKEMWHIYTMDCYLGITRKGSESVVVRWMDLQPPVQCEVSWEEKNRYHNNAYIWSLDNGTDEPSRTDLWTQWGKVKVG